MIPSLEAHRHLPGTLTRCSWDAGWASLLLRRYVQPAEVADLTTPCTPDPLIVLVRRGGCEIESFKRGRWHGATYRTGDLGMTAPGEAARLRWWGGREKEILQLHIPAATVRAVMDDMRAAGGGVLTLPSHLHGNDPLIVATMASLERLLVERGPDLYAEAAAQFLSVHLLTRYAGAVPRSWPNGASGRLALVEDYMRSRLSEPVSLRDLATIAGRSVYQLIRMCKVHWQETPFARLTRLRMERACLLLRRCERGITEIGLECGYTNPSHFATAFRRHTGLTPSRYRMDGPR